MENLNSCQFTTLSDISNLSFLFNLVCTPCTLNFASDFIQEGQANEKNNERAKTYKQFNKQNEEIGSYNVKLIEAQEVKHPKSLKKNYPGGSGIPSNIPKESPYYDDASIKMKMSNT